MRPTAIPGMYLQLEGEGQTATWASSSDVKRRHFLIEGTTLKLFGRRGKTYKGQVNLLAVTDFKPSADATAPAGAIELHVRAARTKLQTCILVPDHSADDLFLGLGNAVPSHATDAGLWRKHMGSRPMAASSESVPREYRMGKTLGTGTFGKVKLGQRSDDGALFAFKCLNRHRIVLAAQSGRLAKEIRLLRLLNHPNVIRLHEVLHTPTEILMVMEYVEGGDLLEVLNTHPRFHESEVRHIFCQICSGVSFCHSLGVAHRDLKPENVLLGKRAPGSSASYVVKVADFGLSTLMRPDEMLQTACGSPHYVAPEILNFDGGGRYDGKCTDVWSLGIILHVMLCYRLPFEAESTQLLYKKIRQGLPSLPGHLSAAAASLLRGMLEVDACHRLTLAQVGEVPSRRTMPICPFRPTPPHTDPYPRAFPPPSPAPSPPPPLTPPTPSPPFPRAQVGQHEWPHLQAIAPSVHSHDLYSQTVDAVVGITSLTHDGSQLNLLSASNLFALGADGRAAKAAATLRRAYTFDALPEGRLSDEETWEVTGSSPATSRLERGLSRANGGTARKAPRSSPLASPLGCIATRYAADVLGGRAAAAAATAAAAAAATAPAAAAATTVVVTMRDREEHADPAAAAAAAAVVAAEEGGAHDGAMPPTAPPVLRYAQLAGAAA
jgi:serine/threonine protein kinase